MKIYYCVCKVQGKSLIPVTKNLETFEQAQIELEKISKKYPENTYTVGMDSETHSGAL